MAPPTLRELKYCGAALSEFFGMSRWEECQHLLILRKGGHAGRH